ncbi:MAG TPA: hypothetical protein VF525_04515 [Pyrinomonadaceae bacterium]|jgi:hypothetical protein
MFKKVTVALLLVCALVGVGAAQKKDKSWTEWSKKDAEKMLKDSPWAQTQIETDTSEMFFTPTARGGFNDPTRKDEGATNQEVHLNYYVRFFSARPIRMALARLAVLNNVGNAQAAEGLKRFAEYQPTDITIVTVWFDSTDQRTGGKVLQALSSAETSTLKNDAYLERKDGKRIFLQEYVKPGKDGFGGRFIFPRNVDGKPFLLPDSGEVRFHAELGTNKEFKVDRRFKVADMMYAGTLEY